MPISSSAPFQSTIAVHSDGGLEPPVESTEDHILIGSAGPDKREMEGIQRALDLLRDKRSADYGWENDTHMVILAKEVRLCSVYVLFTFFAHNIHFLVAIRRS